MKKLILNWLFGTDNVKKYMELLDESINHHNECSRLIDEHLETLHSQKEDIDVIRKLLIICKNHEIDVDKEIKQIEL